mmetsp:Transcript_30395/g.85053  ORF Transcript_30395/g.85053 Transcript_30395/m.85053 type:complete len:405 (+) Transcript_30395:158-1372(+)|eukprot:CAMPEP_0119127570 /NCGR_PEP_ID=MMETSP1310-20130426/6070_1 /TAXON_ID=464262 /ORGANISM="Genus nov. species nov., Strain RCC2339" /LENGTH=404 /DNA_ID=CAMNT_0007117841 /DNA_START=158 /DNA_END=1372 /DNA_ORIENTATION=-
MERACTVRRGGTATVVAVVLVVSLIAVSSSVLPYRQTDEFMARALAIMSTTPLTDGHNDLPNKYRSLVEDRVFQDPTINLRVDQSAELDTDIPRIREGKLGGQFWSVYVSCDMQNKDAVRATMEQIDVVYKMVDKYPDVFRLALTASDIRTAFDGGRVGSLIGIEGGHQIDSSLGALRMFYKLGARYMTLTHSCNTPWADSASVPAEHDGLTDFGREVVAEMNRLGMLVDISHVSEETMSDVLDMAQSPVIFSHSNAYTLCQNPRNVPDSILDRLPQNGGIVMVTAVPKYLTPSAVANVSDMADHIEYIRDRIGVGHIGIGADLDGITDHVVGLSDVSMYPNLIAELFRRSFSDDDVKKILGENIMRVLQENEVNAQKFEQRQPLESTIYPQTTTQQKECRSTN